MFLDLYIIKSIVYIKKIHLIVCTIISIRHITKIRSLPTINKILLLLKLYSIIIHLFTHLKVIINE